MRLIVDNDRNEEVFMVGFWLEWVAVVTGLVAVWHWYQASQVRFPDSSLESFKIADLCKIGEAGNRQAQLNRGAALWTAATVILQAVAGVVSS